MIEAALGAQTAPTMMYRLHSMVLSFLGHAVAFFLGPFALLGLWKLGLDS